jgi:hypothetical protein
MRNEELVIVQRILDLDSRGFSPRLVSVEDMANQLFAARNGSKVGKNRPELKTILNRKYDYKRALCEDPNLIILWLDLVRNTIAKYGITDADIYNFDETGFSTAIVVTSSERYSCPKTTQPGNLDSGR